MSQTRKRNLACGVLIGASLGTAGLWAKPPLPRSAPASKIPASEAKGKSSLAAAQNFTLVKQRGTVHSLLPNAPHVYHVDLVAGQYLDLIVQQRGIDVHLDLFGPGQESIFSVDSANSNHGPEPIFLVASKSGAYRISVSTSSPPSAAASYVIDRVRITPATGRDRRRASALQIYYRARRRWRQQGIYSAGIIKDFEVSAHGLDEAGGPPEVRAYIWEDLGSAYTGQKRFEPSISAYQHASDLFHQAERTDLEALAVNEMAQSEQRLLRVQQALSHFERALAMARAAGNEKTTASVLINLGIFHADRAEVLEADRYLQEALSISKKAKDEDGESKALNGVGLVYLRMGDTEKALAVYQRELRLKLAPLRRAVLFAQVGNAYVSAGRPDGAFQYYQRAYDLQKQGRDLENEASTLLGFGLAYAGRRDFRNALESYRRALEIFRSRKELGNQAAALLNMGWALSAMRRYDGASASFRGAFSLARELKNPILESGVLSGFAWMERQRGNLSEARRQAEQSLALIESVRSGTEDHDLRVSFFSGKQDVYDLLINVIMDQYHQHGQRDLLIKAFEVSESARARGLLDALRARERGAPESRTPVLSLREIQQQALDPDTILLEYSLGRAKSYLWLVTQDDIHGFELPPAADLEAITRDAYGGLARSYLPEEQAAAIAKARNLSKIILGPVAGRLGGKRLLIVASGALQSIPFAVLPDPDFLSVGPRHSQSWPQHLLLRHEIVHEPSASVLAQLRKIRAARQPASDLLAVLADGVFSRNDQRLSVSRRPRRDESDSVLEHLRRLPASGGEANAITQGLPAGRVLKALGFEATRSLVMSGRLAVFRIIHFATHTFYPALSRGSAVVVLSRFDKKGHEIEGLLRIKDIESLDLHSDLIVLSSCNSALGKNVPGEGMVGLPQAFLSAGSSSVVMSLWDVEDRRAAELMKLLYQNLQSGMPLSGALRAAQIKLWSSPHSKSPWFWSGFIAQGEWNIQPIPLNKNPPAVSLQDGDSRRQAMTRKSPPSSLR
jgi:CHAT domain-containing protein/tetratricopeptide (TPR) repeat protein